MRGFTVTWTVRMRGSQSGNLRLGGLRKAAGLHQTSSCARNVVVLPRIAVVTRMEKSMQCPAGGWCGHQFESASEDLDANLRAYTVVGKNWSHDTSAATILRVFYTR